ncbi:MAG: restriction endonuclease subunit S [Chryseobacterium sp.]|nr:MAG: restriction endonuclease subunit S [Chryseobacterium sp.]
MDIYEDYKDSGVSWLGEVPEHWPLQPGLAIMYENKSKNTGMVRNSVLSLSYGKIRVKDESELPGLVPESFETYQLVDPGDLIFRPTDLQNDKTSLRSSISEFEGIITNAYLNFRFKDGAVPKYYHYFFRAIDNNKLIYGLGSGLRQNISFEDFKRFPFPVPPLQEQQSIADFLDEKTAKIDQAIAIKEKEIQLLKERRQILIQELVTGKKVWDGSAWTAPAETKDSGVDWIGEIPKHWEVRKLKYLTRKIGSGITPNGGALNYLDNGVPLLRSQNVHFTGIDWEKVAYISPDIHRQMSNSQVQYGDVLLNITGGSIGRCAVNFLQSEANVNQHVCIVRPNNAISPIFLNLLLSSELGQGQIWYYQQGGGREGLNFQNLKNFIFTYPPRNEQLEISRLFDIIDTENDKAISIKMKEIEKLKEYKTVLINDVVTGKLRVHAGSGKQLTKDLLYS